MSVGGHNLVVVCGLGPRAGRRFLSAALGWGLWAVSGIGCVGCSQEPELPPSHPASPIVVAKPYVSTLSEVRLDRLGCLGRCPVYSVTLSSDGSAAYVGSESARLIGRFRGKVWFEPLGRWLESQPSLLDSSEAAVRVPDLEVVKLTITRRDGRRIEKTFDSSLIRPDIWAANAVIDGVIWRTQWEPEAGPPDRGSPSQSRASFEAAIRNHSTAPPYVLIIVIDERSKAVRSTCTTVNLLLGAIHREYGLDFDDVGSAKTEEIALSHLDHAFTFSRQEALANIPVWYSAADLAAIRAKLAPLTLDQLREGFSSHGKLHSLYQVKDWEWHRAYRDATACVLIERGLSPGLGDRSDQLWLAK